MLKKLTSMAWRAKENPHEIFCEWLEEARQDIKGPYHHAFTLCTTGMNGEPNGRTVLLRDHVHRDLDGNFALVWLAPDHGTKASELHRRSEACAVFLFSTKQYSRQGKVSKAAREFSERHFADLPRQFQIGVWSSEQDKPISSVQVLDEEYARNEERFGSAHVFCPPYYHAYLLHPYSYEFYDGGDIMIHNLRMRFTKNSALKNSSGVEAGHGNENETEAGLWMKTMLSP